MSQLSLRQQMLQTLYGVAPAALALVPSLSHADVTPTAEMNPTPAVPPVAASAPAPLQMPPSTAPAALSPAAEAGTAAGTPTAQAAPGSSTAQAQADTSTAAAASPAAMVVATPVPAALAPAAAGVVVMPEVVVTGNNYKPDTLASHKFTEPLVNIPKTIVVVPQQVLKDQGAKSLQDAVKNVPGITLNAGEGGSTPGDQFNIRGFSARDDIFVDGVRSAGGFNRDAFDIEQVEVSKGPGSTDSGRGSTGGAINIVSKKATDDPIGDLTLIAGSSNVKRGTLDINQPLKDLEHAAIRINAMVQDSGVPGRNEVKQTGTGIAPSLAFGLYTSTRLTLDYYALRQNNTPDYGIPRVGGQPGTPLNVDPATYYGLKSVDKELINSDQASLTLEHDLGDDTVRNQLSWAKTDTDRIVTHLEDVTAFVNTGGPVARSFHSHITSDEIIQDDLSATLKVRTFDLPNTTDVGLTASHESSSFGAYIATSTVPTIRNIYSPNPWDSNTVLSIRRNPTATRGSADAYALYASDTLKVGDRWQVNGGVRYDRFAPTVYEIRTNNGLPYAGPISPVASSDMVSWKGGLVFKPLPNGSIYVSAGNSFNPSGQGLDYDSTNISAILPPEETRLYEVGTKWDFFSQKLALTVAGYRNEKINARTTNPNDLLGPQILDGDQRVDGGELSIEGSLWDPWKIFAGYTYMDGYYIDSNTAAEIGHHLPNIPQNAFTLWNTVDLPWGFQVGGGARYSDMRYTNNLNSFTVPAYHVYDAMLAYSYNKYVTLRGNFYNLADEVYYVQPRFWIRGTPRSGTLTLDIKF